MRNIILLTVVIAIIYACSSQKKQAELLEQTKPNWLKERPVNSNYYFGIGITPKIGAPMLFEEKAKERALADISSQIHSTIKAEAMFYQVEDKKGVHEYLQNRIKSTSAEYLEGYEYVEKWEDLSNVYVFYRLSKQKYLEVKALRKKVAFKLSSEKYLAGLELSKNGAHVNAIEHFALAIDAVSGYLNESTVTNINGQNVDLVSASTKEMNTIINGLKLNAHSKNINPSNIITVSDFQKKSVRNLPVVLKYSGGYLVNDKVKSNDKGEITMPELPRTNNNSKHTLKAEIDLINLSRQVTKNLYVRKLIEQQKAAELMLTD